MPIKPSDKEEEYFIRQNFERKKKLEEEHHHLMAAQEKKKLKALHHMRCPKCGMELIEIDYKHIKIDKCSECAGVWLDNGELEAITKLDKPILGKFLKIFVD